MKTVVCNSNELYAKATFWETGNNIFDDKCMQKQHLGIRGQEGTRIEDLGPPWGALGHPLGSIGGPWGVEWGSVGCPEAILGIPKGSCGAPWGTWVELWGSQVTPGGALEGSLGSPGCQQEGLGREKVVKSEHGKMRQPVEMLKSIVLLQ